MTTAIKTIWKVEFIPVGGQPVTITTSNVVAVYSHVECSVDEWTARLLLVGFIGSLRISSSQTVLEYPAVIVATNWLTSEYQLGQKEGPVKFQVVSVSC